MITKFKHFEAKLYNLVKIVGKSDIFDNIKNINKNFDNEKLINKIYLDSYDKTIKIIWNDKEGHRIKSKIKTRSQILSIKHFNEIFTQVINQLFELYFLDIKQNIDIYDLYLTESNLHIITKINYLNLFQDNTSIFIITVLPNEPKEIQKIIEFEF